MHVKDPYGPRQFEIKEEYGKFLWLLDSWYQCQSCQQNIWGLSSGFRVLHCRLVSE